MVDNYNEFMLKKLNKFNKTFIIAEAGSNHLKNFNRVKKLIDIASDAGADAIKFQSFFADEIATKNKKYNKIDNKFRKYASNLYSFYKNLELPKEFYKKIFNYCRKKKIVFLTSIFGFKSFNFLKKEIHYVKIASFEANYYELLEEIIKNKKFLIISTGCFNEKKIFELKKFFKKKKFKKFAIMHCGSAYPLPFEEANLKYIKKLKKIFPDNFIGYSDHTLGISSCIAAVTLGASIIEKHFTISKKDNSPDSFFSLNHVELKQMIEGIRQLEISLGKEKKNISNEVKKMKKGMRSYYSLFDYKKGQKIAKGMFKALRPHIKNSLEAGDFFKFLNKRLKRNIIKGEVLCKKHL